MCACVGNKVNSLGRATDKERCSCGLSANNTEDKVRGDHDWTLVCCVVYGQTEQNMPAVTMSHYISLIPSSVQAEQLLITKTDRLSTGRRSDTMLTGT